MRRKSILYCSYPLPTRCLIYFYVLVNPDKVVRRLAKSFKDLFDEANVAYEQWDSRKSVWNPETDDWCEQRPSKPLGISILLANKQRSGEARNVFLTDSRIMLFISPNMRLSATTKLVLTVYRWIVISSTYLPHDLQYTICLIKRNNLLSLELSALTMLEPLDSALNLVARTEQHISHQIDKLRATLIVQYDV